MEYHKINTVDFSNIKLSTSTFANMTKNGDLENMKWLKDQGCPWDEYTFVYAVENGDLECLQWLKEQGCPWDDRIFTYPTQKGDLKVLKWLKDQGYSCLWAQPFFVVQQERETLSVSSG